MKVEPLLDVRGRHLAVKEVSPIPSEPCEISHLFILVCKMCLLQQRCLGANDLIAAALTRLEVSLDISALAWRLAKVASYQAAATATVTSILWGSLLVLWLVFGSRRASARLPKPTQAEFNTALHGGHDQAACRMTMGSRSSILCSLGAGHHRSSLHIYLRRSWMRLAAALALPRLRKCPWRQTQGHSMWAGSVHIWTLA